MNFFRKHIIPLSAVLTLAAVGCYEAYWLRGMYKTGKESAESIISSSVTKAEMEEYLERTSVAHGADSIHILSVKTESIPKVVSMSIDSLSGRPHAIQVHRIDSLGNSLEDLLSRRPDLDKIDSIFCALLDSAGLDIECELAFMENDGASGTLSGKDSTGADDAGNVILAVPSYVNDGYYQVSSGSLTRHIIGNMSGTVATSAGILLIIVMAFCLMDRTVKKQRKLEEMKNDFTRNITHELKTPIAVAYAASDTLQKYDLGNDPAKREEYLAVIKGQLDRLSGMVEIILSTAVESRAGLRLDLAMIQLRPMLEDAASQTRLKAGKPCDITVSVLPDSLEATIDRRLMSSVILTILDNAVKYSGNSVKISVKAYRDGQRTLISVSDDGIGIAPMDQKHIFEKFYRVHTGDRHDVKGYGIGLFFAKTIVEKHGGKISVTSKPGKGSSFVIEL